MSSKKLGTKDVKTGGNNESFVSKTIEPGIVKATIATIELDRPNFLEESKGYFLRMILVTEKPSEDFEGFLVEFDKKDGPRYEGQMGKVKASKWAFKDFTLTNGNEINRDEEILKFLKNLVDATGTEDWWNAQHEKHDTIEDFVAAVNKDQPFKDIYLNWCIGGRQYTKQNGYNAWDLYLPKFSKAGVPFEGLDPIKSRLLDFDADAHTEVSAPKPVDDFEAPTEAPETDDLGEIEDAPEFEL